MTGYGEFNLYSASKRPYKTVNKIFYNKIRPAFNDILGSANHLDISIELNKTDISGVSRLTAEIARRHLENDERTLALFKKAIIVNNDFTLKNLKLPYHYDVDLGKLLPAHLASCNLGEKADVFLKTAEMNAAIKILREIDALKRNYGWPKFEELEGFINYSTISGIQLKFGQMPIIKINDLTGKVYDRRFQDNGRIFQLYKRSIHDVSIVAIENTEKKYKFMLDLSLLTPLHLKNIGISDKDIDYVIDSSDYKKSIEFLYKIYALDIEHKARKPAKDQLLLRIVPDLFYPK